MIKLLIAASSCWLVAIEQSLGETYSQPYEFDFFSGTAQNRFFLVWDLDQNILTRIEIVDNDSDKTIQTIDVQGEGLKIDLQLLAPRGKIKDVKELREKIFESVDYNFDGFGDLRLLREFPVDPGKKRYTIYLYDPKKKVFERHKILSELVNPNPIYSQDGKKLIESEELIDPAKRHFQRKIYRMNKNNFLSLQYLVDQRVTDPKSNMFEYAAKVQKSRGLVEVCRWRRGTEGKIQILKGKREGCRDYLKEIDFLGE